MSTAFKAIDPWKSKSLVFRRGSLPHVEVPGATYFVTFRCFAKIVLPPDARDRVIAAIEACDGASIDLDAVVVMPNHAHAIFRVMGTHKLSQVLQRIKGRSARQINQVLKSNGQVLKSDGAVWMDECFDHVIRDETELEEKIEYIRQNPVKGGLEVQAQDYRWLYVRNATG
jgi:REP element-mobilizing transposase RayT